jgi:hypothetical protein
LDRDFVACENDYTREKRHEYLPVGAGMQAKHIRHGVESGAMRHLLAFEQNRETLRQAQGKFLRSKLTTFAYAPGRWLNVVFGNVLRCKLGCEDKEEHES